MARNPNERTSRGAIEGRKPARNSGVWSQVLVKAAGITCGMLALAAIGALATARGLGGQRIALAEPSASSSAVPERAVQVPSTPALPVRPSSLEAGLIGPANAPRSPALHSAAVPATSSSAAPGAGATASEGVTADGKVILNRANIEELGRLPGVGPKRAQAILDLRTKLGRFRRPTDLLRVKGIGPKSLKKLEPHFVLDPPPVPAS
jgi:competence protein ComEA